MNATSQDYRYLSISFEIYTPQDFEMYATSQGTLHLKTLKCSLPLNFVCEIYTPQDFEMYATCYISRL